MGEGEPIGPVGKEWIVDAISVQGIMDPCDPKDDRVRKDGMGAEERCQPSSFMLKGKGSKAAEDEAEDEEREPDTNGA